jgi:hypothetical protein
MEAANTLAYYNTTSITVVKSFIVQAPGHTLLMVVDDKILAIAFNLQYIFFNFSYMFHSG